MFRVLSVVILGCVMGGYGLAQTFMTLPPKTVSDSDILDDASVSGGLLEAHNQVRADHGVGALVWESNLEAYAQKWADHLAGQSCQPEHRPSTGPMRQQHGENIYWSGPISYPDGTSLPQQVSGPYVASRWAGEEENYDVATNRCAPGKVCGHYTQMVWANSTKLGCARATCADQGQIWVCNYSPRGNISSERPYPMGTTSQQPKAVLTRTQPIGIPDAPTIESPLPGAVAFQDLQQNRLPYYVQCRSEDTKFGRVAVAQSCDRLETPPEYVPEVFSLERITALRARLNAFDQDVVAYRRCTSDYISQFRQEGYDATSRRAYEAACAHSWAEVELTKAAANYARACYHYNDHAPGQNLPAYDSNCRP